MEHVLIVCTLLCLGLTGYLWRERGAPRARRRLRAARPLLLPGDVVQHEGADHLVEEVLLLSGAGEHHLLCRLGSAARSPRLYVRGVPSAEAMALPDRDECLWWLTQVQEPLSVPEEVLHEGLRYRVTRRRQLLVHELPMNAGAPDHTVRVIELESAGGRRMLILDGERPEVYAGRTISASQLHLLPAS